MMSYLRMQRNDSKCKSKDHGHHNKEYIEPTIIAGRIEPDKEESRESIGCKIANYGHSK